MSATAQIIPFPPTKELEKPRVLFPAIYRVRGYGNDGEPKTIYTFIPDDAGLLRSASFELIRGMDPQFDSGRLIAKRHSNEGIARGYRAGIIDASDDPERIRMTVRSDAAFTLYHRPHGGPSRLPIIYIF